MKRFYSLWLLVLLLAALFLADGLLTARTLEGFEIPDNAPAVLPKVFAKELSSLNNDASLKELQVEFNGKSTGVPAIKAMVFSKQLSGGSNQVDEVRSMLVKYKSTLGLADGAASLKFTGADSAVITNDVFASSRHTKNYYFTKEIKGIKVFGAKLTFTTMDGNTGSSVLSSFYNEGIANLDTGLNIDAQTLASIIERDLGHKNYSILSQEKNIFNLYDITGKTEDNNSELIYLVSVDNLADQSRGDEGEQYEPRYFI